MVFITCNGECNLLLLLDLSQGLQRATHPQLPKKEKKKGLVFIPPPVYNIHKSQYLS